MADKIKLRNGTAATWTSADPTLLAGEIGLETDTRRWKIGDGATAWTSLPYQYPKMSTKSASYTILDADSAVFEMTTGASNRTFTLPTLADNLERIIEIHKVDNGAGKTIVDGEGAETIDGETTIDLDSQYDYCKLRAGTAGWHLIEYKDHGSDASGSWERYSDGTMRQHGSASGTTGSALNNQYGTTSGTTYRLSSDSITFSKTFAATPRIYAGQSTNAVAWHVEAGNASTTGLDLNYTSGENNAAAVTADWLAIGRWRA